MEQTINEQRHNLIRDFTYEIAKSATDALVEFETRLAQEALNAYEAADALLTRLGDAASYHENLARQYAERAGQLLGQGDPLANQLAKKAHEQAQLKNYLENTRINQEYPSYQQGAGELIKSNIGKFAGEAGGTAYDVLDYLNKLAEGDTSGAAATAVGFAAGGILSALLLGSSLPWWGAALLVIGTGIAAAYLFEVLFGDTLENARDWLSRNFFEPFFDEVSEFYQDALDWIPRGDPLTLDLDGDGIETISADGTVLFDHDGDGTKTSTGWIQSDDGIVVMDRNNNGVIDNGRELFGDNTIKADGSIAVDGFDALSDLDSNGDGLVDASDTSFSRLRIWRDFNADGISQSNELFTLDQLDIESIGTAGVAANTNIGNDNIAIAEGTFTYSNGQTGTTGVCGFREAA